ncbi:MAG: hypothetical protein O3B40_01545 [Actinobacteria bacterium]|jgi:hypothetical protein|nr:hypothetical protein [Ilumatobacteraceae bacterium]MDA0299100.1 hypothetical protein [Actinomycetota bacterium]MDA2961273.1 hypothetical protein [Actinomycetota bacterium]MDA2994032.1 hypothetical protein [Actinomycetota bacterium]
MSDGQNTSVTRDELESTLSSFQSSLRGQIEDRRQTIVVAGVAISVGLAVVAYLLGRRSGRRKSAIIDIRRL